MFIDAAINPADIAILPTRDLSHTTCVVFDILRATSSMITGLANGATEIWPVQTIEQARELRARMPDIVLGGERHGDPIEGFDVGNNPLEYSRLGGRRIATTTTNGTIALRACDAAERVLVGAILNLDAVRSAIADAENVLLVCAGTFETLALEDVLAAGMLARFFPAAELTDSARTCVAVADAYPTPLEGLLAARNGRALATRGWREQVEWCADVSRFDTIGIMNAGVIRSLHKSDA
jgi:2-phosphosulfolactate phosphatase